MKKLFVILMALTILLSGCDFLRLEKDLSAKYFIYLQNGTPFLLNTETNERNELKVEKTLIEILGAKIGNSGKRMVFAATTSQDSETAELYFVENNKQTTLIDGGISGCWIDQNAKLVVYHKDGALYQFAQKTGVEKLSDKIDIGGVSITDDGSHIFFGEDADVDITDRKTHLYHKNINSQKEFIAEIVEKSAAASADHSAICYLKKPDQLNTDRNYPAYIWTARKGEKALPFEATMLVVFGENEIYYLNEEMPGFGNTDYKLYYFDGKESHYIGACGGHLHKFGNEMCGYHTDKGDYVVCQGTMTKLGGVNCPLRAHMGAVSDDGKTVYNWNEGTLYSATAGKTITVEEIGYTGDFSAGKTAFEGSTLLQEKEDGLYLNQQKLEGTTATSVYGISKDGKTACYVSNGTLKSLKEGVVTEICRELPISKAIPAKDTKVLYTTSKDGSDVLYLGDGKSNECISDNVTSVIQVLTWGELDSGNLKLFGYRKGMLYWHPYLIDNIVEYY